MRQLLLTVLTKSLWEKLLKIVVFEWSPKEVDGEINLHFSLGNIPRYMIVNRTNIMQTNHIKGSLLSSLNQKLLSFVLKYTRAIKKFERRTLREVSRFAHYLRYVFEWNFFSYLRLKGIRL